MLRRLDQLHYLFAVAVLAALLVLPIYTGTAQAQEAGTHALDVRDTSVELHVYGEGDALRYSKQISHSYDEPLPTVAVHDASGAAAYGNPATSTLVLLDASGAELMRTRLFGDVPYSLEKGLLLAYSPTGESIAVAAMRAPAGSAANAGSNGGAAPAEAAKGNSEGGANAVLFLFSSDGTLLWKRPLQHPSVQGLAFSDDGAHVAVSSYDGYAAGGPSFGTSLVTIGGQTAFAVDVGFERGAFANGEVLLLTSRQAAAYDLASGTQVFQYRPDERGVQIIDGVIGPAVRQADDAYVLLLGRSSYTDGAFRFYQPRLARLSAGGAVQSTAALEAPLPRKVRLRAGPDGLAIAADEQIAFVPWTLDE